MAERIRVYKLAQMLGAEPRQVLDLCLRIGVAAKNQLSSLNPAQRDAVIRQYRINGPEGPAGVLAPLRRPPRPGQGHAAP